jgi:hypothetical protein
MPERGLVPISQAAIWHGTAAEWSDLWMAIEAQCNCSYDLLLVQSSACAAHLMLTEQLTLDHLVHIRRLRAWFVGNEFCTAWPNASPVPTYGLLSDGPYQGRGSLGSGQGTRVAV